MEQEVQQALTEFTTRFCQRWQQTHGSFPRSEALYGIPSPCVIASRDDSVEWQPQPFTLTADLHAVEQALDIIIQPAAQAFYTTQFAGDMPAQSGAQQLTLLQAWSEDDFRRVQENLIGHLVTQRRLKLSPTLFIATLASEMDVISLCNLSGEVVLETLGTTQRQTLSPSLAHFLRDLEPML